MQNKKGSFKEANRLVQETPASQLLAKANNNHVATSRSKEAKSIRLNLLIKPSTKKNIDKIAAVDRISTNELINRVLEKYIANKKEAIEKYDRFYGED